MRESMSREGGEKQEREISARLVRELGAMLPEVQGKELPAVEKHLSQYTAGEIIRMVKKAFDEGKIDDPRVEKYLKEAYETLGWEL